MTSSTAIPPPASCLGRPVRLGRWRPRRGRPGRTRRRPRRPAPTPPWPARRAAARGPGAGHVPPRRPARPVLGPPGGPAGARGEMGTSQMGVGEVEVVEHRQQLADERAGRPVGLLLLLAGDPLAVVVELRLQPLEVGEVLVPLGGQAGRVGQDRPAARRRRGRRLAMAARPTGRTSHPTPIRWGERVGRDGRVPMFRRDGRRRGVRRHLLVGTGRRIGHCSSTISASTTSSSDGSSDEPPPPSPSAGADDWADCDACS